MITHSPDAAAKNSRSLACQSAKVARPGSASRLRALNFGLWAVVQRLLAMAIGRAAAAVARCDGGADDPGAPDRSRRPRHHSPRTAAVVVLRHDRSRSSPPRGGRAAAYVGGGPEGLGRGRR